MHGPRGGTGVQPGGAFRDLLERVAADGGVVLATYREPVGQAWQAFVMLPIERVTPTPYQRDLSPSHAKRLQEVVKNVGRFVDPIVVVSPHPGTTGPPTAAIASRRSRS